MGAALPRDDGEKKHRPVMEEAIGLALRPVRSGVNELKKPLVADLAGADRNRERPRPIGSDRDMIFVVV